MGWPIKFPNTIYAIRCKVTKRMYIGRTYRLEQRIAEHFRELEAGKNRNASVRPYSLKESNFQEDYNRYGKGSFEVYILEENVQPDKCQEREAYWISKYLTTNPAYGYNRYSEKSITCGVPVKKGLPPMEMHAEE